MSGLQRQGSETQPSLAPVTPPPSDGHSRSESSGSHGTDGVGRMDHLPAVRYSRLPSAHAEVAYQLFLGYASSSVSFLNFTSAPTMSICRCESYLTVHKPSLANSQTTVGVYSKAPKRKTPSGTAATRLY